MQHTQCQVLAANLSNTHVATLRLDHLKINAIPTNPDCLASPRQSVKKKTQMLQLVHSALILSNIQWGLFLCPRLSLPLLFLLAGRLPSGEIRAPIFVSIQRRPGNGAQKNSIMTQDGIIFLCLDLVKCASVGEALWTWRSLMESSLTALRHPALLLSAEG